MKIKYLYVPVLFWIFLNISGCALPTVAGDLDGYIGTPFTNPKNPNKNIVRGNSYIWSLKISGSLYYEKEIESPNIRYFFSWYPRHIRDDCRYSLLVGPDDIILSWRNEGPTHVSKCTYS